MIKYIKIKNFLTFEDEQTFYLTSSKERRKKEHVIESRTKSDKLLKLALVYGANGAGKSNLVNAIALARTIAIDRISVDLSRAYCRINKENMIFVTKFEFGFNLNGAEYSYRIEFLAATNQLTREEIRGLGSNRLLFSRNYENRKIYLDSEFFANEEARKRLEMYHEDSIINRQSSFLSIMNQDKELFYEKFSYDGASIFREIFKALKENLIIARPDIAIENALHYSSEESLVKINEMIRYFNIGITGLETEEVSKNELAIAVNNPVIYSEIINSFMTTTDSAFWSGKMKAVSAILHINNDMFLLYRTKSMADIKLSKVFVKHKNNPNEKYQLSEESDGTRRLLELVEVLINDTNDKTFVIDEFDRCLHPLIAKKFISKFLESKTKSQLIVTTHQDDLLDQNLIRRDEVWFADRQDDMGTRLYPLCIFGDRFDKALQKAYLGGEYRGIPEEVTMD